MVSVCVHHHHHNLHFEWSTTCHAVSTASTKCSFLWLQYPCTGTADIMVNLLKTSCLSICISSCVITIPMESGSLSNKICCKQKSILFHSIFLVTKLSSPPACQYTHFHYILEYFNRYHNGQFIN